MLQRLKSRLLKIFCTNYVVLKTNFNIMLILAFEVYFMQHTYITGSLWVFAVFVCGEKPQILRCQKCKDFLYLLYFFSIFSQLCHTIQ